MEFSRAAPHPRVRESHPCPLAARRRPWFNMHMPVEIENPKTAEFVPLLGTFNPEYRELGSLRLPDEFSFEINWTLNGDGQDILREHIRAKSVLRLMDRGRHYQGTVKHESGFNTSDGLVVVAIAAL